MSLNFGNSKRSTGACRELQAKFLTFVETATTSNNVMHDDRGFSLVFVAVVFSGLFVVACFIYPGCMRVPFYQILLYMFLRNVCVDSRFDIVLGLKEVDITFTFFPSRV